jgi:hypothetical protein
MSAETQPAITHKEKNRLWEDYEHDWPVTSVPRNPEFFEPAPPTDELRFKSHFLRKLSKLPGGRKKRSRIVRNCIEAGNVYPAEEDNRYRFLWTDPDDNTLYSLIVHLRAIAFAKEVENHFAVTVYEVE